MMTEMQNKAISNYNDIGHDPTDEIQHEIETAYLDSIAESRTSFDGILSMINGDKSDTQHDTEQTDQTMTMNGQEQETNSCSNSFSASTPGPVSFPCSPDSGLYSSTVTLSPCPVKTDSSEIKAYTQQTSQTIQHTPNHQSTDSTQPSFGFESGYGPPVGNNRFKYNWADPTMTSLTDLFANLSYQELDDIPIQDHFYNPPPGYSPRKGMEEVLARMKKW